MDASKNVCISTQRSTDTPLHLYTFVQFLVLKKKSILSFPQEAEILSLQRINNMFSKLSHLLKEKIWILSTSSNKWTQEHFWVNSSTTHYVTFLSPCWRNHRCVTSLQNPDFWGRKIVTRGQGDVWCVLLLRTISMQNGSVIQHRCCHEYSIRKVVLCTVQNVNS